MNRVPVSVVIPTYNCGHYLTEALDSVLGQTVTPQEILVIDDGSTDDTRERLIPYAKQIRCIYQENQGVSAARNQGIQESQGELVAFLDSDDVWHPRKLELQMEILGRRPELGFLGTSTFDWPALPFPEIKRQAIDSVVSLRWEQFVARTLVVPSSVMIRRNLLIQAGGFDNGLRCSEDRDLWLRISALSPVAKLDLPLTGYRFVLGSLSQQLDALRDGGEKVLRKLDERGAWKGRRFLRRKAYSFFHYQCSYEFNSVGDSAAALQSLIKSFGWYPFPYDPSEVDTLARLKRFVVYLLRWLRLKSDHSRSSSHLALTQK
jgi:glycosyltransferase involved in cell wall biosynthesis